MKEDWAFKDRYEFKRESWQLIMIHICLWEERETLMMKTFKWCVGKLESWRMKYVDDRFYYNCPDTIKTA